MLALEIRNTSAVVVRPSGATVSEAMPSLRAVQRLTRATRVALLCLDRRDGVLSFVAGADTDVIVPVSPDVRHAIESGAAYLYGVTQPFWIVAPRDAGATLVIKLAERGSTTLLLTLDLQDATAVSRARMAKLAPDLATLLSASLDLETRNGELEQQHAAAVAAMDHADVGVIAVRADHSVVFANAAASAMLADATGLQVRRGVLRPAHYGDTVRFQSALNAVTEPGSSRMEPRRAFVMLLTPELDGRPVVVAVAPLSKAGRVSAETDAVAIVHLLAADVGGASSVDVLCQLHGLSRVETRLVRHLCSGTTISEAAVEMRIKVDTARAYLKQVFGKTNTHRQADLALLINRYARAIQGHFDFQLA